jgi:hypothetical protein
MKFSNSPCNSWVLKEGKGTGKIMGEAFGFHVRPEDNALEEERLGQQA